jgi:sortase A
VALSSRSRTAARWAGDILLTLAAVVILLAVYQLWWTNVEASRAADSARTELVASWGTEGTAGSDAGTPTPSPSPSPGATSGSGSSGSTSAVPAAVTAPPLGEPFALMYIPRLRDSVWATPVLEGVGLDELAAGIGHYPGTAMPGQIGNFAVAGHRATHGEPLKDIDRIRAGDRVIVETKTGWYVYELVQQSIVTPKDTWVIEPVPGQPGATPTQALITVTTCNPRWASTERWIWWGTLVEQRTRADGPPADIQQGA